MSKVTVPFIQNQKGHNLFRAFTAYDYTTAQILNTAQIEVILVGDSLANVIQGAKNTIGVTIDQMVYHTSCVAKACDYSLLVSDLPFQSYQESNEYALRNAAKLIQEGQAEAVKMEGGINVAERIATLFKYDIPVMAHIGLTPQSYNALGGHKKQGTKSSVFSETKIMEDAIAVSESGAFAVVLECIPEDLAESITKKVKIPTIGIGSGSKCDAQIYVTHDLLGLTAKQPSFVQPILNLRSEILKKLSK